MSCVSNKSQTFFFTLGNLGKSTIYRNCTYESKGVSSSGCFSLFYRVHHYYTVKKYLKVIFHAFIDTFLTEICYTTFTRYPNYFLISVHVNGVLLFNTVNYLSFSLETPYLTTMTQSTETSSVKFSDRLSYGGVGTSWV